LLIVRGPPFNPDNAILFGAIGGKRELEQAAGETAARFDEGEEAARRQIHPLQRALDEVNDLAHEPVIPMRKKNVVGSNHRRGIAARANDDRTDCRLIDPQMKQCRVELPEHAERPELISGFDDRRRCSGEFPLWALDCQAGDATRAIDLERDARIVQGVFGHREFQGTERDAAARGRPVGGRGEFRRPLRDPILELRRRMDGIDEPPLHRSPALDALGNRAEYIREIAPHLALVHDAREPARSRQHCQERCLWKADGRIPVVHEQKLVARQRR
jgi:hypothetical protein